jgi:PST family polysaccharide transporter
MRQNVEGRGNLQKLIGNTFWLFADRMVRLGVGLWVGIWIARYLGPEQFGLFNYATAFVALFSVFATLGLDGIVIRELVDDPSRKDEILGTAFTLKLAGGCVTLAAAVASIYVLRPNDSTVHLLVAIIAAGTLFQSFDAIDFWFQSRTESRFAVYARSSAFLSVSILKIVLIVNQASLVSFAWAGSLEILLGSIGLVLSYRRNGQRLSAWRIDRRRIAEMLKAAWPLTLSGIAVIVYMKIDQVMLGQMLDDTAVGIYSAAVRISEVWYFIPVSIVASVTPALIEARRTGLALYQKRLFQLFRLMSVIALAIAIPMTFASDVVVRVLYRSQYEGAGPILAVHIWAALFVFLGVAQGPWSINEGFTRLALFRTVLGAVVNVFLNLIWIPRFGPIGAAIATTASYALSAVLLNFASGRTREIFWMQLKSILVFVPGKP